MAREASAALFFSGKSSKSGVRTRVAYVPAVEKLDDELLSKLEGVDVLLLDGTFWSDDELIRIQGSGETAHQMGHIPVEESLRLLKNVRVGRRDLHAHQQHESDPQRSEPLSITPYALPAGKWRRTIGIWNCDPQEQS